MAPGNRAATRLHNARPGGILTLLGGLASAAALTGAAVYTVEGLTCGDGGQYVRHARHIELIDGCVDGSELPPAHVNTDPTNAAGFLQHDEYMP